MRRKLVFSLFAVLVMLLLLEVGLRVRDAARGRRLYGTHGNLMSEPMRRVVPFRMMGVDHYANVDSNRLVVSRWGGTYSYRKPRGTYRIVCFGGSTTENLRDSIHYPLALQSELRDRLGRDSIEVINVGNGAYATPHAIILLSLDVISWDPDLVVVSHNVNDLTVSYWSGLRPDYWNKYAAPFYTTPDYASRYTLPNLLFEHSRLYWFVKRRMESRKFLRECRERRIRRRSYGDRPPGEACELFARNLRTFVTIAERCGINVAIGNQPLYPSEEFFRIHMAHKPYVADVVFPRHEEFVKHHGVFNTIAADVARSMDVLFVDNAAVLSGHKEYFFDFVHHTAAGNRRLAANYADAIVAAGLIKPGDSGGSPRETGAED